jgi:predicted cobalt transporter CbtA
VLRLQSGVSGEAISILRRVQSVRALLTALFVATQVIGVVPLLSDHTKEVYERALAVTAAPSEAIPANSASDRIDPDGDLDDDCCALHSLAGPLPNVASIAAGDLVSAHVLPKPASPLAGRHSTVLERPPKHTPSSDRTQA